MGRDEMLSKVPQYRAEQQGKHQGDVMKPQLSLHQIAVSQAKDGGVDEVRTFQATETPCAEA